MSSILEKLKSRGWYLTTEKLETFKKDDVELVIKTACNLDFREIACGALPTDVNKATSNIPGKIVLQISKIINISAPKSNQESKTAPRFLQIDFTDGKTTIQALELEQIQGISIDTPPGTKVYFTNDKIELFHGYLIIRSKEIQVLGGKVLNLIEKWELNRKMNKYSTEIRLLRSSSGPPRWVAFGQGHQIKQNIENGPQKLPLKQITQTEENQPIKENEFVISRNEAIAEAAKSGNKRTFGGANNTLPDFNLKKITDKGYSENEARLALKSTRNNLERAMYSLKRQTRNSEESDTFIPKNGRRFGNSKKLETSEVTSKPSVNVSLFDFLTDKLTTDTFEHKLVQDVKSFSEINTTAKYVDIKDNTYRKPGFENNMGSISSQKTNINDNSNSKNNYGSNKLLDEHKNKHISNRNVQQNSVRTTRHENPFRNEYPSRNENSFRIEPSSRNEINFRNGSSSKNENPFNKKNYEDRNTNYYSSRSQDNLKKNKSVSNSQQIGNIVQDISKLKITNKPKSNKSQRELDIPHNNQNMEQTINQRTSKNSHDNQKPSPFFKKPQQSYDPSKILGFQNKEANEYAISMLKSQGVTSSSNVSNNIFEKKESSNSSTTEVIMPVEFVWNVGDLCLAKYWDDGQYYDAQITAITPNTFVVLFVNYGNYEEILKSDCLPVGEPNILPSTQPNNNQIFSHRYRHERQMYIPPPKREN